MRKGFYVLYGVMISAIIVLVYFINLHDRYESVTVKQEVFICGTPIVEDHGVLDNGGDPAEGKRIFNMNCAACHHLDRPMTGPSLRRAYTRFEEKKADWFSHIVKGSKEQVFKNEIDWKSSCMKFPQLTEENAKNLAAYTQ